MIESQPIPQEQKSLKKLTAKDAIIVSALGGAMTGLIANSFWGGEAGKGVGIGTAGLMLGTLTGLHSHERHLELAKEGRRLPALLKRLQAFLEISAGYGIPASQIGFALGRQDGAAIGLLIGATWGAITDILVVGPSQAYASKAKAS